MKFYPTRKKGGGVGWRKSFSHAVGEGGQIFFFFLGGGGGGGNAET